MVNPLLQRSLEMRHTLRRAPEPHLLAEIIPPSAANTAVPTRHSDLERDAVAEGEIPHVRADGDDDAGGLMAKGEGRAGAEVAVGEFLVVAYV